MELEINHTSSYSYECPVVLEAHYLRFKPLRRPNIVVKEFDLQISPTPVKLTERLDAENNNYHQAWLNDEPTRRFDIEAGIRLTSHPCNPFDFLMDPDIFLPRKTSIIPINNLTS
ncbi:MAG: transglutaminase N-terminal domain-containing protein [Balneolaceae bacterium]|nr:transglutaminase N-terminal domain-containing protein [Balneolaceae bacterium]